MNAKEIELSTDSGRKQKKVLLGFLTMWSMLFENRGNFTNVLCIFNSKCFSSLTLLIFSLVFKALYLLPYENFKRQRGAWCCAKCEVSKWIFSISCLCWTGPGTFCSRVKLKRKLMLCWNNSLNKLNLTIRYIFFSKDNNFTDFLKY